MSRSGISWTDKTWNPITGCSKVSPACDNCYALTMSRRLQAIAEADFKNEGARKYLGTVDGESWSGSVRWNWEELRKPTLWEKPCVIFPCSMSDIFHHSVPERFIDAMFEVMTRHAPQHVYTLLTKRPERIPADNWRRQWKNLWLGVTAENQKWLDRRWKYLREIPAEVLWLSIEPMLGQIWLPQDFLDRGEKAWVVVGGESGKNARPMHPTWVRWVRDQCVEAGVRFHFKQWGEWHPVGPLKARQCIVNLRCGYVCDWDDPDCNQKMHDAGTGGLQVMYRVGRRTAGRELDGKIWDERPDRPE